MLLITTNCIKKIVAFMQISKLLKKGLGKVPLTDRRIQKRLCCITALNMKKGMIAMELIS